MAGSFLLDTNIVIGLFANDDAVLNPLARADSVSTSAIVLGELYFGARKSAHVRRNLARISDFAARVTVLGTDGSTAAIYGEVKHNLRILGRPIPENDIWIAAAAIQHGLTLVTRDGHFDAIENLQRIAW